MENTYTFGDPSLRSIEKAFNHKLAMLPSLYEELDASIGSMLHPAQVMITGYPDPTRNQHGVPSALYGPLGIPLIDRADARFASRDIASKLDNAVAAAAATYQWTLVDGFYRDFETHGYPSTAPWINTITAAEEAEGSLDGAFHPNAAGQHEIAQSLMAAYQDDAS